ncbi:MAG: type IIL restriction-modification enzyme MmeI [Rhodothermales bacterium]|nr:type IIL restriction-modification enzyme MmeI [Rhodothermales bacterium]
MLDPAAFISHWKKSSGSERANLQSFINDLCDLLEVERPAPSTNVSELNSYCFERAVVFDDGDGRTSTKFIDLYKKGCYILEGKQGTDAPGDDERVQLGGEALKRRAGTARRGTRGWAQAMTSAKNQAFRYARALKEEWPPLLIVVDVGHCIDLYADFQRQGKTYAQFPDTNSYRILIEDLVREEVRERLRAAWTDPMSLDPTRRSARVTRVLADRLARLAASFEGAGYEPDRVAQFLMRCLFTMFAEDVGLIPDRVFTNLLTRFKDRLDVLPKMLSALWATMNAGGFSPAIEADIVEFNGGLFADQEALPLTLPQLELIVEAAEADWKDVEPAIFGTLLERALDPVERHKLGAHYTPRAYVERLVMPTIIEPLRAEWEAAQAAASLQEQAGDERAARKEIETFQRRLCSLKVLDPACGSGNFLYVTLEHLKRIEGEVQEVLLSYKGQQVLDMTGAYTVSPDQLLGLEINPRAARIADVVLWIGYLQWHMRTRGDAKRLDPPILKDYKNIKQQDAVLAYDAKVPRLDEHGRPVTRWDGRTKKIHPVTGEEVPDDTARVPVFDYVNPREATWPKADFIVGNPPFVGPAMMREALGDGYTEALRRTYKLVPDSADYVMFWWHKAAEAVRAGEAERFGFIATNSLRQTFNRKVLQYHMDAKPALSLAFAIPDHPWVDSADGAAVRISMTVGTSRATGGVLFELGEEKVEDGGAIVMDLKARKGEINFDLSVGNDFGSLIDLAANQGVCQMGIKLHGMGFVVSAEEAIQLGINGVAKDDLNRYIRPFINGKDLVQRTRGAMVIDLFGLSIHDVIQKYPEVYQWILDRVKPERDQNNRQSYRENWWIFGEPRSTFRPALEKLDRYIVTCRTAKHRIFAFIGSATMSESKVVMIALDDPFFLGVLSSKAHVIWAARTGGWLGVGNDSTYNHSDCFNKFPFPDLGSGVRGKIKDLAEQLDAHRKRQQEAHPDLTMTGMYNVVEKLRAGVPLTAKEKIIHEQGLVSVLKDLHDRIDAAVAEAYGWPADLSDEEILERLVALNKERAAEEARGLIRYLRPEYQARGRDGHQAALEMGEEETEAAPAVPAGKTPWPKSLAERVQAVQRAIESRAGGVTAAEVAGSSKGAKVADVESVLQALEMLGHVRQPEAGRFVV